MFTLFVPAGAAPAGGWPVAIFGHGFTDSKNGPPAVAASLAAHGIATIAIDVVGHGGGAPARARCTPRRRRRVTPAGGGRGIDQDGNGTIDSTEGVPAAARGRSSATVTGYARRRRPHELVRVVGGGVDVDGDGTSDLKPRRDLLRRPVVRRHLRRRAARRSTRRSAGVPTSRRPDHRDRAAVAGVPRRSSGWRCSARGLYNATPATAWLRREDAAARGEPARTTP